MEIINKIFVDQIGWVYTDKDDPIVRGTKNGEMSPVEWFFKGGGKEEYNGKYVIAVL